MTVKCLSKVGKKKSLPVQKKSSVFLWDEYVPKIAELISPIFLDADGHSSKAIKSANIRGLVLVFFTSPAKYHFCVIHQSLLGLPQDSCI